MVCEHSNQALEVIVHNCLIFYRSTITNLPVQYCKTHCEQYAIIYCKKKKKKHNTLLILIINHDTEQSTVAEANKTSENWKFQLQQLSRSRLIHCDTHIKTHSLKKFEGVHTEAEHGVIA